MRQLSKRTSRRVNTLKDSDYDHEIGLVDAERRRGRHPPASQPGASVSIDEQGEPATTAQNDAAHAPQGAVDREDQFQDAREQITPRPSQDTQPDTRLDDDTDSLKQDTSGRQDQSSRNGQTLEDQDGPSIEVEGPTPFEREGDAAGTNGTARRPKSKHDDRETEIDILWENERGAFLCGTALFSGAALGNLDPSPWTNQFHKTSPTNIKTAQVPDPTWEWAWPDWRINREEGVVTDEFGWEYSFMFAKKFSWHGPKWWNSFVRRRAWIRKRVKKREEDLPSDPHMLNTDYFNITPARTQSRSSSVLSARGGSNASVKDGGSINSKPSMAQFSKSESIIEEKPDIENVWMLLMVLRGARIDREKIEAVENYLENAQDGLEDLQTQMHDIMSLFVFQASRQLLLSRLTQVYDEMESLEKDDAEGIIKEKRKYLGAAIKHADEEVKRLSYWSDVKKVTEEGTSKGAVAESAGWNEDWQGVDQSGPAPANAGKLP